MDRVECNLFVDVPYSIKHNRTSGKQVFLRESYSAYRNDTHLIAQTKMSQVTIEELRVIPQLRDMPDETLQWIIDRSELHEFDADEILVKTGDPIDEMWIIVTGGYDFYMDTNGQLTYTVSWGEGDIAGLLPYSRMKTSPGYAISTGPGKALMFAKKHFDELEKQFPELVKRLVEILTDRVRWFTSSQQQLEKMSALGRMSAGLAHELNNPASAIQRTSIELNTRLTREIDNVLRLIDAHPEKDNIMHVLLTLKEKSARSVYNTLSTIERAQVEEKLLDTLNSIDMEEAGQVAETLAEIGVTADELEWMIATVSMHSVVPAIQWIENIIIAERLVMEIHRASNRISQLVNSIKSYVHMDRSSDMQPTDVHGGLESTLILLNHKIRKKNIEVVKLYADHLPEISAFPGEVNQVWTNLIDNAIDAMSDGGTLTLTTSVERNMVRVCIIDTGHGVPDEIKNKIFDPFFTTKPIGKGVGLGLDLVKNIVHKHNGKIYVTSEPGKTKFIVCFPIIQKSHTHHSSEGEHTV